MVVFQSAIETPKGGLGFRAADSRISSLPAKLAFFTDDRMGLDFLDGQPLKAGGRRAVLAKVHFFFFHAIEDAGDVDGCLVPMAFGAEWHEGISILGGREAQLFL